MDQRLPVGRKAYSLTYSNNKNMAVGLADEEARAEVDVLKSRLDKTKELNKKIEASLARLNGVSPYSTI